jgi:hypothetical protein
MLTMSEHKQEIQQEQGKEELLPVKKHKRVSKSISQFFSGEYLSNKTVVNNLYFLVYLAILAMLYIGNTYYAEKTFKDIEKIKNELKEYRFQYITAKSALMFHSQQSEIAVRATCYGLQVTTLPPYKVFYTKSSVRTGSDTLQKTP